MVVMGRVDAIELDGSRSVESRLVDRVLDNVTQTLPEVVDDAAIKNKQLTDELVRLQEQLHDNQVFLTITILVLQTFII